MNAYTTIEESKQLIEAGLDVNTADMLHEQHYNAESYVTIKPWTTKGKSIGAHILPCWSLAALLNIINNSNISYILGNNPNSESGYIISITIRNPEGKFQVFNLDKITGCITWLLKNNYIKSNKNE